MNWGAVTGGLLFALLALPGKAPQFLAALGLFTILASWAWSASLRAGLSASRPVVALRVARFETLELSVLVENRSRLSAHLCVVSDAPGSLGVSAEDGRWALALPPRGSASLSYAVKGVKRGAFCVGPIRISCADPLGLFPFVKEIDVPCSVLILPARVRSRFDLERGVPQGAVRVRDPRYEDVTLFRSVRDYLPGDELRRVNWKASARLGGLYTNEFESSLTSPVFVFLNLRASDYPSDRRRERAEDAIELAAAFLSRAASLGQRCGLASNGATDGEAGVVFAPVGSAQEEAILDMLARIELAEGPVPPGLFERSLALLPTGARFILVGPEPAEAREARGFRAVAMGEGFYEVVR
ncbi:MAG TPA: DUF58 domain-containing protein [Treponemataceae bacterium]|nr:DUF58 domain-containing protein [Treponemataceae bacterium]